MIALDAYAIIAYFHAEPAGPQVRELLSEPTVMSVLNVAESVDRLVRHGRSPDDVQRDFTVLERAGLRLAPLTDETAIQAGLLRARHYHRRTNDVSMADCVAAATALREKVPLATADPALVAVMRAEGGDVHVLPDSRGSMP